MISAIIPVKNGEATLARCLYALRQQKINYDLEIIVLDSGSTDRSVAIAKSYAAKIIDVPASTFNHGATRNLGVQAAKGDFVYLTVQDAFFADENMLQKMVDHLKDKSIVAVNGMQAVEPILDNNPAVWFKRASQPATTRIFFEQDVYQQLSHQQQFAAAAWDNVNALYRKSAVISLPFQFTNFAEDRLWARAALLQNASLLHDPAIVVYHYHHLHFSYHYRTELLLHVLYFEHFKVLPALPNMVTPLRRSYHLIKNDKLSATQKIKWIGHNLLQTLAAFAAYAKFFLVKFIGGQNALKKLSNHFKINVPQGKLLHT